MEQFPKGAVERLASAGRVFPCAPGAEAPKGVFRVVCRLAELPDKRTPVDVKLQGVRERPRPQQEAIKLVPPLFSWTLECSDRDIHGGRNGEVFQERFGGVQVVGVAIVKGDGDHPFGTSLILKHMEQIRQRYEITVRFQDLKMLGEVVRCDVQ